MPEIKMRTGAQLFTIISAKKTTWSILHIPTRYFEAKKGSLMKPAVESIPSAHTEQGQTDNQAPGRSGHIHYTLVAVLFAVACLILTIINTKPGAISSGIGSGFLLSWLAGGFITLGLLTLAAKR
jgi:hypothetical protein